MSVAQSQNMTAITIDGGKGPASALRPVQVPMPIPSNDQLLIRVRAAGVNRPDIIQRLGSYPPPPGASDILGLEVAGEVEQAAGWWKAGDKVCALLGGGGYAEYAVCDPRHALPIPAGLSFEQAASLPETVFTVYANVFEHGGLKPGETLLVHGATSGIGVTAIQMAKAAGAKVIATARGAQKAAAARTLGADVAIDAAQQDFAQVAKAEGGADVILDMVGGDYFGKDIDALNRAAGSSSSRRRAGTIRRCRSSRSCRSRRSSPDRPYARAMPTRRRGWRPKSSASCGHGSRPARSSRAAHAYLESGTHTGKVILVTG